jgi:hypothetical protein
MLFELMFNFYHSEPATLYFEDGMPMVRIGGKKYPGVQVSVTTKKSEKRKSSNKLVPCNIQFPQEWRLEKKLQDLFFQVASQEHDPENRSLTWKLRKPVRFWGPSYALSVVLYYSEDERR